MTTALLDPDVIRKLLDLENRLFYLNMIDRWSREDREEYTKLTGEREKLRRGGEAEVFTYLGNNDQIGRKGE